MKNWTTDKIIAVGLMGTFAVTVICMDIVAVIHGGMSIEAIAKELAIGLFSYMGRGMANANPQQTQPAQQSRTSQTLGKVAATANEGQKIIDAVDTLKETFKK